MRRQDKPRDDAVEQLYRRPGFLLRRANQIAEGVFLNESAAFGVTPTQCGTLLVAHARPGLDQKRLGQALGFDRATTGEILKGLEARGLIVRTPSEEDARKRCIHVTPRGATLLRGVGPALDRAQTRLFGPLSADEATLLVSLLRRLCDAFNGEARAPLVAPAPAG